MHDIAATNEPTSPRWHRRRPSWLLLALALIASATYVVTMVLTRVIVPMSVVQISPYVAPPDPFSFTRLTIDRDAIERGGPRKDGIPALSAPKFVSAAEADFLEGEDRVIGVAIGGESRAYPLLILNHHEIVNDKIGQTPLAVTYCPLCDSAAVFDRRTPLGVREFGVSGLLYNSNVLMFDREGEPESLWSQMQMRGVSGPGSAMTLTTLPLELTAWSHWRKRYPQTKVLSRDTGHQRDYARNPYAEYFEERFLMFASEPTSDRFPSKTRVLGVWTGKSARAYPQPVFGRERTRISDVIDGKKLTVSYDTATRSMRIDSADDGIQSMYSFWFAWYAFHPDTSVYSF